MGQSSAVDAARGIPVDSNPSPRGSPRRQTATSSKRPAEPIRLTELDGNLGGFDRSTFAQVKRGRLEDCYDIFEELGTGSFGVVNKARDKEGGHLVATKTIAKKKIKDPQKIKEEFNVIRQLDHPSICKAYECYEDRKNIYLVMELLTGGTLLETLCRMAKFTEADGAAVMRQILSALAYLHEANFIFRDLKNENIMFSAAGPGPVAQREVKLIDFGLCCEFQKGSKMCRAAGTPYSVAPELITSPVQYDQKCDAWSAGVVMYILLSGKYPFSGKTKDELLNKIRKEPCNFGHSVWKRVSKEAKTLLAELLRKRAVTRISVGEALMHPWLAQRNVELSHDLMLDVVESFKHFQNLNMFQKAAVTALAWRASDEETKKLREIFSALDRDGNGHITVEELRDAIMQTGVPIPTDLVQLCVQADTDGGGNIEYTEFLAAAIDKQKVIREDVVWEAFRVFDQDGSGTITKKELLKILTGSTGDRIRQMHGNQAVDNFVGEYDDSGDGQIDFEEFLEMLNAVKDTYNESMQSARRLTEREGRNSSKGSPRLGTSAGSPRANRQESRRRSKQVAVTVSAAREPDPSNGDGGFCAFLPCCTQLTRSEPIGKAVSSQPYEPSSPRLPRRRAAKDYDTGGTASPPGSPRIGIGAVELGSADEFSRGISKGSAGRSTRSPRQRSKEGVQWQRQRSKGVELIELAEPVSRGSPRRRTGSAGSPRANRVDRKSTAPSSSSPRTAASSSPRRRADRRSSPEP